MAIAFFKKTKNLKKQDIKDRAMFFKNIESHCTQLSKMCKKAKTLYKKLDCTSNTKYQKTTIDQINMQTLKIKSIANSLTEQIADPNFDKYVSTLSIETDEKIYQILKLPNDYFTDTTIYKKINHDNFMLIKGPHLQYNIIAPIFTKFNPQKTEEILKAIKTPPYEVTKFKTEDLSELLQYQGNYFPSLENYLKNPPKHQKAAH